MEDPNVNLDTLDSSENSEDISNQSLDLMTESPVEIKTTVSDQELDLNVNQTSGMTEAEYVYSLIESAIPENGGYRKNISKRDFALWVLPIVAINAIRRFTSKKIQEIVKPYDHSTKESYLIKGTETVYTSTKNVFQGQEKMRFFGFRFMSIWVFPMAITGAFMEFLFVGPLNGTNPFG